MLDYYARILVIYFCCAHLVSKIKEDKLKINNLNFFFSKIKAQKKRRRRRKKV
jgi:hypothetical protein